MIKIKQPRLVGTRLETPRITANELHKSRWDGTGSEQAFCMFSLRTARADALPKNQHFHAGHMDATACDTPRPKIVAAGCSSSCLNNPCSAGCSRCPTALGSEVGAGSAG